MENMCLLKAQLQSKAGKGRENSEGLTTASAFRSDLWLDLDILFADSEGHVSEPFLPLTLLQPSTTLAWLKQNITALILQLPKEKHFLIQVLFWKKANV